MSATSGANITGAELARAIMEAAQQQSSVRMCGEDPTTEELNAEYIFEFQYDSEGTQRTMKVTSYAPAVFERLRDLEGIAAGMFHNEWMLPKERCSTVLTEGRSMAMFLKSLNHEFMCKTIAQAEVDALKGLLKNYYLHIFKRPQSVLMRFLMLLKVEANNDVGFLLVFADSFAHARQINERWDIKGRVPKPGKFRYIPPKDDEINGSGDASNEPVNTELRATNSNFLGDNEAHPPGSPMSMTIPTTKDKELTRLFWMETDIRDAVVKDLNADFDFLSTNNLMDYSILIGVRYNAVSAEVPEMRANAHLERSMSPKNIRTEVRPTRDSFAAMTGGGTDGTSEGSPYPHGHQINSRYHVGVPSVLGEETYFIAIIDMLTSYNGKKVSANFFKSFLWTGSTLSTVPPADYKARISQYVQLIFAAPEDDLDKIAQLHADA